MRVLDVVEEYKAWLYSLVEVDQPVNKTYNLLLKALYDKNFQWFVPNDDNRAYEGKNLREQFCEGLGVNYCVEEFPKDCSMLELIIALAYRCQDIMVDTEFERPMNEWFWQILSNVGLDKFDDEAYYEHRGHLEVDDILDRIINRSYGRGGNGGLFPLKKDKKDQRKVELWYQMNAYLVENYY